MFFRKDIKKILENLDQDDIVKYVESRGWIYQLSTICGNNPVKWFCRPEPERELEQVSITHKGCSDHAERIAEILSILARDENKLVPEYSFILKELLDSAVFEEDPDYRRDEFFRNILDIINRQRWFEFYFRNRLH